MEYELQSLETFKQLMLEAISSRELRTKRANNAMAPINRLPLEIFTDIIRLCVQEDDPRSQSSRPLRQLTQVSSDWYNDIKATPSLWRYLSSSDPASTRRLVTETNQTMPLTILCGGGSYRSPSPLKFALEYAPRWGSVFIAGYQQDVLRACSQLSIPTQRLAELYIYVDAQEDDEAGVDGSPEVVLGEGQNLEALELDGVSLSWDSGRLTGLQVLSLRSITANLPTISELYATLSSSPALQVLILADLGPDEIEDVASLETPSPETYLPIQLDRLSKLQLERIPSRMRNLLLSVLGSSCPMRLDIDPISVPRPPSAHLPSILMTSLTAATFQEITVSYSTIYHSIHFYTERPRDLGTKWVHNLQDERPGYSMLFRPKEDLGWSTLASWLSDLSWLSIKFTMVAKHYWHPINDFPVELFHSLPSLISIDVGDLDDLGHIFEYLALNDICPRLNEVKIGRSRHLSTEELVALVALVRRRQGQGTRRSVGLTDVWAPGAVVETLQRELGEGSGTIYHLAG